MRPANSSSSSRKLSKLRVLLFTPFCLDTMISRHLNKYWTRFVAAPSLCGILAFTSPALAQRDPSTKDLSISQRVALVIGNDAYLHVSPLEKAANDARAVGDALEKAQFKTKVLINASRSQMNAAINQFVENIGGGGVGVFFFAGHGVQLNNQNFLIPVDIQPIQRELDIADQAVSLQIVQDKLAEAKVKFALLIVDACRDNPLPKRAGRAFGGLRGLSQASSAEGQMVVFSAGANQQALDKLSPNDSNPNGLFTREFLPWLVMPGVTIRDAILGVRTAVRARARSVNHEQFPAIYDQAEGNFFFQPSNESSTSNQYEIPTAPSTSGLTFDDIQLRQESRAKWDRWQNEMRSDFDKVTDLKVEPDLKIEAWDRFLKNYSQKNPFVNQDEQLRNEAKLQLARAEEGKQLRARVKPPNPTASVQGQANASIIKDCDECPELVVIPTGTFIMGSPVSELNRGEDEGPVRHVSIPRVIAVGRFEVTFDEWDACVKNGGCQYTPNDNGWGRGRRPVINVAWEHTSQYLQWLSRKTNRKYRLLTEAEWEYVARADSTTTFTFGETLTAGQASAKRAFLQNSAVSPKATAQTEPVGTYPPNAFGLFDVHGNVSEWVEDCVNSHYRGAPADGSAWLSGDCTQRILRGGSWDSTPKYLRSASRGAEYARTRSAFFGFRVARDE